MVSQTTCWEMIRRWKIARLSADTESLGFPRINILVKALEGRGGRNIGMTDEQVSDADIVQTIVNKMPEDMRSVFEANQICLIREERCTGIPHEGRANILGIPKSTYWHRFNDAVRFVNKFLNEVFDMLD